MRQLRRLGLPLTRETISIPAKILAECDPTITRHQPGGGNPGCARELYYRTLAYNSVADIPENVMAGEERPHKPINVGTALLVYHNRPEVFLAIAKNLPPEKTLKPPDDSRLDGFLLSLPKFTAEQVKGNNAYGHPLMSREKKIRNMVQPSESHRTAHKRRQTGAIQVRRMNPNRGWGDPLPSFRVILTPQKWKVSHLTPTESIVESTSSFFAGLLSLSWRQAASSSRRCLG